MTKVAIVTGITGQDGSYLAELLLEKDYRVIGLHRRSSINNFERINHILKNPQFKLEEYDLTDPNDTSYIINKYQPHEVYNLAAQSHVGTSFKQPTTTFEINTIGVINLLESIKRFSKHTKFYQASTSEMFGSNYDVINNPDGTVTKYQDENTNFLPQSPYAIAKLASYRLVQIYRQAYSLYCCSGILFNHESPRRGENFVTRKITTYIGQLVNNKISTKLQLGNLDSYRDWGHAKDYVRGMWQMMQHDKPDDYVLSTERAHSVKEFLKITFEKVNLDYQQYIEINPEFYRPSEVDYLNGKSTKARSILGWAPEISFEQLANDMVDSDIKFYAS